MIPLEANRKRAAVEPALGNLLPHRGLAQVACHLLRGHRVDVKAGAPFKTRRAGELRHDLDVPVVGRGTWGPGGGGGGRAGGGPRVERGTRARSGATEITRAFSETPPPRPASSCAIRSQ